MESEPRKGKPIVRWGRKVMDLPHTDHVTAISDRQTAEGFFFGGFFFD